MSQITLTFPDGNARDYPAGVTAAEVAESIAPSLAKRAISASLDGTHIDLAWPITASGQIAIHSMKDERRRWADPPRFRPCDGPCGPGDLSRRQGHHRPGPRPRLVL